MKNFTSRWSDICHKPLRFWIIILCKIFVIGLLLQFFLQTFITFKLGRNGKFWTLFRMWKEFILLIFMVILIWYVFLNIKGWIKYIKSNDEEISWNLVLKNMKSKFIIQFILIFLLTTVFFLLLSLGLQHVGVKAFILSVKYDLSGFFIFGIGACLSFLFFTEEDKNLLKLYNNLIIRVLWLGLIRRFILWLMPNSLKLFGYDPTIFEGTVGQNPPATYYTQINHGNIRNQFLFERPTSFGFRLIAFFPVFVLCLLRNKKKIDQIFPVIMFGVLILSTWSRAGMVIRALEATVLFFILYRKFVKKQLVLRIIVFTVGLGCIAYLGRGIMVRSHSNTGHLELVKTGRNISKENLLVGRGAGYSGPASHQLCYTDEPINIFQDIDSIHLDNYRCELLRKENVKNQISTYGFNPENQYLQILMEYGIIGMLFRLGLCVIILRYTTKMVWGYRKNNKSPYQELLYYSLLGFGIGFVGLCIEGLVLHSLVDRMVIYPFFLLYGITIGLWEKEKDNQYFPPEPKKKKKRRSNSKSRKKLK